MTNYERIYWLTRMDALHNTLVAMFVISIIALGIYLFVRLLWSVEDPTEKEISDHNKRYRFLKVTATVMLFVGGIGQAFVPTRNEAILIMAGGATLNYAQSDTSLSKLPYQTTAIISEYMDKAIKEMKEDKK